MIFKTEKYQFGVWTVKATGRTCYPDGSDNGVRYWDTEQEAWDHLAQRAIREISEAQKALDRARRNHAKVLKKQLALREAGQKNSLRPAGDRA